MTQGPRISLYALMLAAAGLPLYLHLPQFAAQELGLSLASVALVLAILRVVDFLQDPLLGRLAQHFPARGKTAGDAARRRGILGLVAGLLMALGFLALFTLSPRGANTVVTVTLALFLVFTGYSLGTILFYGQSTALAPSRAALMRMAGYREAGSLIGVLLAAAAPALLLAQFEAGYALFGAGLAALCLLATMLSRPLWRPAPTGAQARLSLAALRDSGALALLALAALNSLPVAITSTLFLFFVQDQLQLGAYAGPFLILFFLSAALAVPVWSRLGTRFSPRLLLICGMGLAIASFVSAGLLRAGDGLAFALICAGSGAALAADMVILPVLFARSLERAGLGGAAGFGLWTAAAKLALALAAIALLPVLQLAGYVPGGANDASALSTLTFAYATLPCLIKCAALALAWRLPGASQQPPAQEYTP